MRYGYVKNNVLMTAFPMLIIDGVEKWFPTDAEYIENGFKRIITSTPPEIDEEHHLELLYTENEEEIHQTWLVVEGKPEADAQEIVEILTGGAE